MPLANILVKRNLIYQEIYEKFREIKRKRESIWNTDMLNISKLFNLIFL